ncbi:hypothetical protein [Streptomyces sp. A1547]|uniref:hypothetical protein n=1 Tax=Streptomyces sp. A1547 TaxID=2563105 RepID=UPI00109E799E|nr:hypothetical protein E6W17_31535 [Streptomyces sp. A1547]
MATAPALPAPDTAPPLPPVQTVVMTWKATAPAAREGFDPHWSHARSALPVSFIAVRDSRSQEGILSSGTAKKSGPTPGMEVIAAAVESLARPVHGGLEGVGAVEADEVAERGAAYAVDDEARAEVPGVFPYLPGGNGLLDRLAPRQGLGPLEGFGVVAVHASGVGAVVLDECVPGVLPNSVRSSSRWL